MMLQLFGKPINKEDSKESFFQLLIDERKDEDWEVWRMFRKLTKDWQQHEVYDVAQFERNGFVTSVEFLKRYNVLRFRRFKK